MHKQNKKKATENTVDKEVEKIFEATWKNWASRRACERTHIPGYIKKQKK